MKSSIARVARVAITPERAFPLGGFAGRASLATGVHQPLEATVLALQADDERFVWVGVDVLAIMPDLRDAIVRQVSQRTGVAAEQIVVIASHTHAAPAVWHGTIHPVLPAEADVAECNRVAEAIGEATASAQTRRVTIFYGESVVTGVGANRHDINGPADRSLGALLLRDAESGEPIAAVFDYACHATVLGAENTLYSPDWVGGARAAVRDVWGADLPVLYLPGAGGDVSTRFGRRARTPEEAERLGRIVGAAVVSAMEDQGAEIGDELRIRRGEFSARTRSNFHDVEAGAMALTAAAPGMTPPALSPVGTANMRLQASFAEGRASQEAFIRAGVAESVSIPWSLVQIGERRWFHTPFEIGETLASRVLARSTDTRFIGYSGAYNGYLVDAASTVAGHYEARSSYFDLAETDAIVAQLRSACGIR